jgi:TetR/AcrR family transcriptional regulator, transcriptional repressor for nem operon
MFAESVQHMKNAVAGAAKGEEVGAIVNSYLSAEHRDHPEQGCLLPVLAPEIAHQPLSVRKAYTRGFNEQVGKLAQFMPGEDEAGRRERARVLMAGMAGTMMFARAVSDRELSDQILAHGRDFYSSAFSATAAKLA